MRNVIHRVRTMTFTFLLQSPPLPTSLRPFLFLSSAPLSTQRFLTPSQGSRLQSPSLRSLCTQSIIPNMQDSGSPLSYLTQREAAEIDETLMGPLGFTVDQLMVLHFSLFFSFVFCYLIMLDFAHLLLIAGIGWS